MHQVKAKLIDRSLTGTSQELQFHAPKLALALQPGQPLLIRSGWGFDPYLRRTLYPIATDAERFTLRLPPSGDRGLSWLRMVPLGSEIDCLGPVGVGFSFPAGIRNLLCLGEGDGGWSLLPVVTQADANHLAVTLAVEANSARNTVPAQRLPLSTEYRIATVDGSAGRKGRLDALLPDLLRWADAVIAAASMPFYRRLADAIEAQRVVLARDFAQALYPGNFLCGVGACHACAADVAGGRRRVCLRGPVFDLVDLT